MRIRTPAWCPARFLHDPAPTLGEGMKRPALPMACPPLVFGAETAFGVQHLNFRSSHPRCQQVLKSSDATGQGPVTNRSESPRSNPRRALSLQAKPSARSAAVSAAHRIRFRQDQERRAHNQGLNPKAGKLPARPPSASTSAADLADRSGADAQSNPANSSATSSASITTCRLQDRRSEPWPA